MPPTVDEASHINVGAGTLLWERERASRDEKGKLELAGLLVARSGAPLRSQTTIEIAALLLTATRLTH